MVRQQPEIFCCALIGRRSRSAWLLSNGTAKSTVNRRTCSRRSSSRVSRFAAFERAPVLGGFAAWP
jgi:hypothetical protein